MSDPYGRNKMPNEPKKPKLFSPWRPFKAMFLLFIEGLAYQSDWEALDRGPLPFVVGCIYTFPTLFFGFSIGWWALFLPVITWLGLYALKYMMHLDDKETMQYWHDRLSP